MTEKAFKGIKALEMKKITQNTKKNKRPNLHKD